MHLVYEFLEKKIKLTRDNKIVIAVSAGPDSMCLLYILLTLREKIGCEIIVAHINHNIRLESVEEEQFLKEYCLNNNLIFESMKITEYQKGNFHQNARNKRYEFYQELIDKYQADYLMTAHHGDDLVETVLMRLVRGSNLSGYSGFSLLSDMHYYQIVRPLIYVTKEDIMLFNTANNIPFYIDKSNASDKYTRNRYRKQMLPFLKEEDNDVHLKFLKFSNTLKEYSMYIEKVAILLYNNIYKDGCLDILLFNKEDDLLKKVVIDMIFVDLYSNISHITDKHRDAIISLADKNKSGSKLSLPNNIIVSVSYDKLYFLNEGDKELDYKYELTDNLILSNGMKFEKIDNLNEKGNDTCHMISSEISLPLYVRNRRSGDRIELKGMTGSKKINEIFIDKKISQSDRDHWPIVVDSNDKIVWIPMLKKSKYDVSNSEKCDIIFKCLQGGIYDK